MKLDPRALVLLTIVAMAMAVVGWASPAPSTFSKAVADSFYCAIASANCLNHYCNNPITAVTALSDNCNTNFSGGYGGYCPDGTLLVNMGTDYQCSASLSVPIHMVGENATKRTFSSSTFTTYTKVLASDGSPSGVDTNSHHVTCTILALFNDNNILAVVKIKVRETTAGRDGPIWMLNTLIANDNFTVSYGTSPIISGSTMYATSNSVFAFQISVSGTGSVTVYNAMMDCFISDQVTGAGVG